MFLINFNLVKFLFEDLWVKRKLTRDVPVTRTTWNIFNIHKTLQQLIRLIVIGNKTYW